MPLLVINLGGEMLYVLEQRLGAQKVKSDKSQRVLCDVVKTMFSRRFVEELFKPQFLYKDRNVRQIFDKLAHSSIMKLNETSMGKLYSLMVMGAKFQIVRVATPCHLLDVTIEHLEQLKTRIANLKKGSKQWWQLNRQLLVQSFKKCQLRLDKNLDQEINGGIQTLEKS